jgi:hypothetical protein
MAWFGALAATYLKYGDSASVKGNSGAFGGQISGRAFSQTGISATTFDFVIGSVDTGWHWDLNAMWGLGGWSGRRFAVGVTGGLRYAGLGGGGMPFALGVPAELAVQVAVRPNLVVLGYARPIWNLGKDNSRRKKGSTIGVFADELQLGAQVALAKLQRASSAGSGGLVAGLTYHEWAKTRFFGVSLGYGQVSHD